MTLDTTTHQFAKQTKDVETVIATVAKHFGHTPASLLGRGREEPRNTQRQIAMLLAREHSGMSYPDLARAFLKEDHGTIMHACESIRGRALRDPKLSSLIAELRTATASAIALSAT